MAGHLPRRPRGRRFWRRARAFGVMMLVNSAWTTPMCPEYADYLRHVMATLRGDPEPCGDVDPHH